MVAPRGVLGSTRLRMVGVYLALLVAAGLLTAFLVRQVLLLRLEDRVDAALTQEIEEVEELLETGGARGVTSGTLDSVISALLVRNVPSSEEGFLAFSGPELTASNLDRFPLLAVPDALVDEIAGFVREPGGVGDQIAGTFATVEGEGRFRAIRIDTGGERGAFVVVALPAAGLGEIRELQLVGLLLTLAVVVVAGAAAWLLAGRVLAPVAELTETAGRINATDLTSRIPVHGSGEAAEMARTFNGMLDRLERAQHSQRELISNAGHELRVPMTVILGHIDLLRALPEGPERDEAVAVVIEELDRMARMVDDLLVLAGASHPDYLRLAPVDLVAFADDVLARVRTLGDRDWVLRRVDRGTIDADRDRLLQAILNLAQNALHHTGPGDRISLGSAIEGSRVRFWVEDTGPGVPADQASRIFDRFTRGPDAARRYRGAGLGLAIVRGIAEAHGGTVELDSGASGARFSIVIPMVRG
jgi:signal transduction histidine kinase